MDVQGRLRARRNPHAAGGGAGLPLHGTPDRAVWTGADSGEPGAFGARDVWPDLSGRRPGPWVVVPLFRRAGGGGSNRTARAARAGSLRVIPSPDLWPYAH